MRLLQETIQANARFFGGDLTQVSTKVMKTTFYKKSCIIIFNKKVPKQALTVGVGTVMDAREVMILITGAHKAYALHMVIYIFYLVLGCIQKYILLGCGRNPLRRKN